MNIVYRRKIKNRKEKKKAPFVEQHSHTPLPGKRQRKSEFLAKCPWCCVLLIVGDSFASQLLLNTQLQEHLFP